MNKTNPGSLVLANKYENRNCKKSKMKMEDPAYYIAEIKQGSVTVCT